MAERTLEEILSNLRQRVGLLERRGPKAAALAAIGMRWPKDESPNDAAPWLMGHFYTNGTAISASYVGVQAPGPLLVSNLMTVDALACEIVTPEAGIPVRISLYTSDFDRQPTKFITSGTAVTTSAEGALIVDIQPIALNPAWYFTTVQIKASASNILRFRGHAPATTPTHLAMTGAAFTASRALLPTYDVGTYDSPIDFIGDPEGWASDAVQMRSGLRMVATP